MGAKANQDLIISPCAYSVSQQVKFCVINMLNKNVLYIMFFVA